MMRKPKGIELAAAGLALGLATALGGCATNSAGAERATVPATATANPGSEVTPTITAGGATETTTSTAPAETTTSTTKETTPSATEQPTSHETAGTVLDNSDAEKGLSPELVAVYENIYHKVEAGDITYEMYQQLTEAEKVLVQQALMYRLTTAGGAGNMDSNVCYANMKYLSEDPGCSPNFANPKDTNKDVMGKLLLAFSANGVYTTHGANGLDSTLDPNASRILTDMAFSDPSKATGILKQTYDKVLAVWSDGKFFKIDNYPVVVADKDGGSGEPDRMLQMTATTQDYGDIPSKMAVSMFSYTIDAAKAAKFLGVTEPIKLNAWKVTGQLK